MNRYELLRKLNKELRPRWSVDWNAPVHVLASDGSGEHQAKARDAKTAEAIVECRNSLPAVLNLIEAARLVDRELWDEDAGWTVLTDERRERLEVAARAVHGAVAVFVSGQEEPK